MRNRKKIMACFITGALIISNVPPVLADAEEIADEAVVSEGSSEELTGENVDGGETSSESVKSEIENQVQEDLIDADTKQEADETEKGVVSEDTEKEELDELESTETTGTAEETVSEDDVVTENEIEDVFPDSEKVDEAETEKDAVSEETEEEELDELESTETTETAEETVSEDSAVTENEIEDVSHDSEKADEAEGEDTVLKETEEEEPVQQGIVGITETTETSILKNDTKTEDAPKEEMPNLRKAAMAKTVALEEDAGIEAQALTSEKTPPADEITNRYQADPYVPSKPVYEVEPSKDSSNMNAGKLSQETLDEALKLLNLIRYTAGLPEVKLNEKYSELAQNAAFISDLNNALSHTPDKPQIEGYTEEMYTNGWTGANKSNLGLGHMTIFDHILGCMYDGDPSNIEALGHRRWLLSPTLQEVGFGQAGNGTATYVVEDWDKISDYEVEDYIAWPATNMPVEWLSTVGNINSSEYPWSVSLGSNYNTEDLSKVEVILVKNGTGQSWSFGKNELNLNNDSYGRVNNCIIFRPDSGVTYADGDTFTVKISGLTDKDGNPTTLEYGVNMFSLNRQQTPDNGNQGGGNTTPDDGNQGGGNITPDDGNQGDGNITPDDGNQGGGNTTPDDGELGDGNTTPDDGEQGGGNITPDDGNQGGGNITPDDGNQESGDSTLDNGSMGSQNNNSVFSGKRHTDKSGFYSFIKNDSDTKTSIISAGTKMSVGKSRIVTTIGGVYETKAIKGIAITTPLQDIADAIGLNQSAISAGTSIRVYIHENSTQTSKKTLMSAAESNNKLIDSYFNVDLYTVTKEGKVEKITEVSNPITITIGLPEKYSERDYSILTVDSEGKAVIMEDLDSAPETITINIKTCGAFAIVY